MMEEQSGGGGGGGVGSNGMHIHTSWLWATASVGQLGWAVVSYRKGHAGDHRLMPLKAFAVASLFVGAMASAGVASLRASGIHKVEDFMEVGATIRTVLGVRPRARDE